MDITGIGSIFEFGSKLVERIWPDPSEAAKAKLELLKLQESGKLADLTAQWDNAKAQIAVNQVEAAHQSIFVAGWRPAVGWVCVVAMLYKFVILPIMLFFAALFGHDLKLPMLDFTEMLTVLFGMLGLGAMDTFRQVRTSGQAASVAISKAGQ